MSIISSSRFVRYLKLKHQFHDSLIAELVANFKVATFDKNSPLLRAGDLWDKAFFVERGLLRLYYSTQQGKEFNKGFFAEDDFIWPMAPLAREQPSLFSIAAIEDTQVLWASFSDFQNILLQQKLWSDFALPYVEALVNQKFLREYQFLVHDAKSRYLYLMPELGSIFKRLTDYHIASYMGITHVALSRIKSQIVK